LLNVVVVGAGHVGAFTAPLLASLSFRITLVDSREEAADPARLAALPPAPTGLPEAVRLLHGDHDDPEILRGLPADLGRAAALVMTHDHALDQTVVEWALGRGFGFVGGVGSRAKAARTRDRLELKGFAAADIARVRMPVGVDVGARTPAEIGVAIAAELVAWRASLAKVRPAELAAAAPAPEESSEP
jgi:xanthine dehydrogenase accessory factor